MGWTASCRLGCLLTALTTSCHTRSQASPTSVPRSIWKQPSRSMTFLGYPGKTTSWRSSQWSSRCTCGLQWPTLSFANLNMPHFLRSILTLPAIGTLWTTSLLVSKALAPSENAVRSPTQIHEKLVLFLVFWIFDKELIELSWIFQVMNHDFCESRLSLFLFLVAVGS